MAGGCILMPLIDAARLPLVDAGITTPDWMDELMGLEAMGIGVEMGLEVVAKVGVTGVPEV